MPGSPTHIRYRDLRTYKYALGQRFWMETLVFPPWELTIPEFVTLDPEGNLSVGAGYAWDGPSGPTVDTKDFMRGSLVHDAIYQLLREIGGLSKTQRAKIRLGADKLLRECCLKDGMDEKRANMVFKAVRGFGEPSTKPGSKKKQPGQIWAP